MSFWKSDGFSDAIAKSVACHLVVVFCFIIGVLISPEGPDSKWITLLFCFCLAAGSWTDFALATQEFYESGSRREFNMDWVYFSLSYVMFGVFTLVMWIIGNLFFENALFLWSVGIFILIASLLVMILYQITKIARWRMPRIRKKKQKHLPETASQPVTTELLAWGEEGEIVRLTPTEYEQLMANRGTKSG